MANHYSNQKNNNYHAFIMATTTTTATETIQAEVAKLTLAHDLDFHKEKEVSYPLPLNEPKPKLTPLVQIHRIPPRLRRDNKVSPAPAL